MTRSVSYGPSITFSIGNNILHDLAEPAAASDAATKNYVDGLTSTSASFATPAFTLSTANSAGTSTSLVRSNAQIAVFNVTAPVTQAFSDVAATGSAAFAARQDHTHGMPATPVTSIRKTGSSGITGSFTLSQGVNVSLTQSGSDVSFAVANSLFGGAPWTTVVKAGIIEVELFGIYASPAGAGTPDLKVTIAEDNVARGIAAVTTFTAADAAFIGPVGLLNTTSTIPGTAATNRAFMLYGWLASTGAAVSTWWAQNTSGVNPTIMRAGSIIRWRQII